MSPSKTSVPALALVSAVLLSSPARAVVVYDEGVSGDLSNNQAAPTPITLAGGVNSVIGNANGTAGDSQDWASLTVPAGFTLSSIILFAYASNDAQGFTGFQTGATFVGSPFTAASYTGYSHFGTGATNGSLPPTNLIGADLIPIMDNPLLAAGAQGFTPPLPAGTYTFLIQQLGAATNYQFDYVVTPVPAPAPLGLAAVAAAFSFRRRRAGR